MARREARLAIISRVLFGAVRDGCLKWSRFYNAFAVESFLLELPSIGTLPFITFLDALIAQRIHSERMIPAFAALGIDGVDEIIASVISDWEKEFPDEIISWYLIGSYSYGAATQSSDLDIVFVTKSDDETPEAQQRAEQLWKRHNQQFSVKVEAWVVPRSDLPKLGRDPKVPISLVHAVSLKHGSRLLRGIDLRDEILDPSAEQFQAKLMEIAHKWSMKYKQKDPDLQFSGYLDGDSTAPLAYVVLSIAAALSVRKTGKLLCRKIDFAPHYRETIADEWSDLVMAVHDLVWQKWGYQIPAAAEDVQFLDSLCTRARNFERHFDRIYGSNSG